MPGVLRVGLADDSTAGRHLQHRRGADRRRHRRSPGRLRAIAAASPRCLDRTGRRRRRIQRHFAGASDDGRRSSSSPPNRWSPRTPTRARTSTCAIGDETIAGLRRPDRRQRRLLGRAAGGLGDGSRAFFTTQERLTVDDDFAGEEDVYGWSAAGTLLVSVEELARPGARPAAAGPGTNEPGLPEPLDRRRDHRPGGRRGRDQVYTTFDCSGEPVAQGTAAQLASPGLTVTFRSRSGSTTSFRATAEAEGVVSACSRPVSYKQEDLRLRRRRRRSARRPRPNGGGSGNRRRTAPAAAAKPAAVAGGGNDGIAYVAPQTRITFGPASRRACGGRSSASPTRPDSPAPASSASVDRQALEGLQLADEGQEARASAGTSSRSRRSTRSARPAPRPVKRAFKVVADDRPPAQVSAAEAGFTLVELLVASAMGVIVMGAVASLVISAVASQPKISKQAQNITHRPLGAGAADARDPQRVAVNRRRPPAEVSFEAYVRHTTCGGSAVLAAHQPGDHMPGHLRCTTTACSRRRRARDPPPGRATPIFSGLDSNQVFTYVARAPTERDLRQSDPAAARTRPAPGLRRDLDGASLRNATLGY